jgi:hypothetical protein
VDPDVLAVTIIKEVGSDSTLWVAAISAAAGLLGVGVGGVVTWKVEGRRVDAARKADEARAERERHAEERRVKDEVRAIARVELTRLGEWKGIIETCLLKKVWVPVGAEPQGELSIEDRKLLFAHLERAEMAAVKTAEIAVKGVLLMRDATVSRGFDAAVGGPPPVVRFQAASDEEQFQQAKAAVADALTVVERHAA